MATTHPVIAKVVERGFNALDAKIALGLQKLAQIAIPNCAYLLTDYTGAATTVPTAVTDLVIANGVGFNGGNAVVGGRAYQFEAWLPMTVNGTSGATILCNGGTATFSAFTAAGYAYTAAAVATLVTTAAASAVVDAATAYTSVIIKGSFTASDSGSFGLRLGTHASTTAALILAGAYVKLLELPGVTS